MLFKTNLLLTVLVLLPLLALAQTNTFPQSGNVGIGTTSPREKLHVNGAIFTGRAGTSLGEQHGMVYYDHQFQWSPTGRYLGNYTFGFHQGEKGSDNTFPYISGYWGMDFFTNRTHRMRITRSGNVGIGTANPRQKLHVNGAIFTGRAGTSLGEQHGMVYYDHQFQWSPTGRYLGNYTFGFHQGEKGSDNTFPYISGYWGMDFFTNRTHRMRITRSGNVGIGTTNPTAKLTVAGNIHAREVKVTADAGADFVFEEDYPLRSLPEVEQFVKKNKHLPEIAPAAEMVKEGVKTGAFQIQLLQKVEELTLYMIAMQKEVEALKQENGVLKSSLNNSVRK